MKLIKVGKKF